MDILCYLILYWYYTLLVWRYNDVAAPFSHWQISRCDFLGHVTSWQVKNWTSHRGKETVCFSSWITRAKYNSKQTEKSGQPGRDPAPRAGGGGCGDAADLLTHLWRRQQMGAKVSVQLTTDQHLQGAATLRGASPRTCKHTELIHTGPSVVCLSVCLTVEQTARRSAAAPAHHLPPLCLTSKLQLSTEHTPELRKSLPSSARLQSASVSGFSTGERWRYRTRTWLRKHTWKPGGQIRSNGAVCTFLSIWFNKKKSK